MTELIKFAIVGYGHIGKRHAELIKRHPDAILVAICEINPDLLAELELQVATFNSLDEMLDSQLEMDVVCIATPNGIHAEQSLKVLQARKHVVIEKPMALTKADCEKIIFKALHVHRQVFCVMQNRYSPPSQWLKEVLDSDVLGNIYMVQVNCYWNRDDRYYRKEGWKGTAKLDGGTLFTQFSHFVDILYWLFGDITDIQAKFGDFNHKHNTEFEDSGLVNFRFINGGMGCINYSTSVWDKNFESSLSIIAEKGTLKIGGQYMNKVEYCNIKDYIMPQLAKANEANDYGTYKGSAANHNYILENVVDVIRGKTAITTNALEGLKVVEIIERIYSLRSIK